nr:HAD family phosphatase [Aestuariimicrobium ganziense]
MRPDTSEPGQFAAVLWDMDGTLVDTEPIWMEVQFEVVEGYGGTWSEELAHRTTGQSNEWSCRLMIAQCPPQGLEVAALAREVVTKVVEKVSQRELPWQPGSQALLNELDEAGIPQALVTASPPLLIDPVLAHLPQGFFGAVVNGVEVSQGKPHPEPYLTAAERLGVDPRLCLAIEDSIPGSQSASSAGALTIAVPSATTAGDMAGDLQLDGLAGVDLARLREIWRTHRA